MVARGGEGIAPTHSRPRYHRVSGQRHAPAALYPREEPRTRCTGGWVGHRAGLDAEARRKILLPLSGIEPRSPGRPDTALTELPGYYSLCCRGC
jgi:hypothetical protein